MRTIHSVIIAALFIFLAACSHERPESAGAVDPLVGYSFKIDQMVCIGTPPADKFPLKVALSPFVSMRQGDVEIDGLDKVTLLVSDNNDIHPASPEQIVLRRGEVSYIHALANGAREKCYDLRDEAARLGQVPPLAPMLAMPGF